MGMNRGFDKMIKRDCMIIHSIPQYEDVFLTNQ